MGVSSILIISLPDGVDYPEQLSVRPTMEVAWVGDVGPYDVLHEWDTVDTFDSGDLITDANNGQTSPDTGVPPSDIGGATSTWFYQVTVTDTDDAGSLTSPDRTIEFFDDVDVTQHKWWHYLLANITPGFDSGEVDDPLNANRYLYLLANITTDQPCPWIQSVVPSLQQTGESITVMGDSFGATQPTFGGEVRIYDEPGFGGSFVTLTQTAWSDTEATATVPTGATSGFVTVVHTTGTPTCSGSNQKFITIEQTPADPEAGWWVEFFDFKNVNKVLFSHTGEQPDIASAQIAPVMNDIGNGFINIPFGQLELIDELIDPENDIASFVRVYLDERYRYGFYTDNSDPPVVDIGAQTIKVAGDGMESVARRAIVRPFDHPANPTRQSTWIYGSTDNLIKNGAVDEDLEVLKNPGGEEGNDDEGDVIGWSQEGGSFISGIAVNDGLNARTGDWYIRNNNSKAHSGLQQSVSVEPSKVYHVQVFAKDPLAGEGRITLALGGHEDMAAIGVTYPNNFPFGGEILAELDNVASTGTGCPGGDTDGTWQVMDVEVKTHKDQTSLTMRVQDDHHGKCVAGGHNAFWIDDLFIEGWGLGLSPWEAFQPNNHASNSFRLDRTGQIPGSLESIKINPLGKFAGIKQTITVTPNSKYTYSAQSKTASVIGGDFWTLEIVRTDTGAIIKQEHDTPVAGVVSNHQAILTMPSDVEEVEIRFLYSGPNNPGPMFVDNLAFVPGEPASTIGKITQEILAPIQARGVIDFLNLNSFDDERDSLGNLWFGLVALDIEPGSSVYDVLSRFVALGYEWEIVPVNFRAGGDTGVQLNLYNSRSFGSGVGRSQIIDEKESIVLGVGMKAIAGGSHQKRAFTPNVVFAMDQKGNWSEDETADIVADTAAFGRIEKHINVTAGSVDTLAEFAGHSLTEEEEKAFASKYAFTRDTVLRPFLHFGIGDTVFEDPADNGARRTKRIRSITADLAGEGTDITYTVDLSRVFFEDEAAVLAAINQLLERAPGDTTGVGTGSVTTSSTGFVQTVIVSEVAPPHNHSLSSAEITNKVATGDVTGTLPGPLQVGKIVGRRVSGVPPGINDLFVWNAETELWEPRGVPKATIFLLGGM